MYRYRIGRRSAGHTGLSRGRSPRAGSSRRPAGRAALTAAGTGLALALAVAGCAGPPNVTTPASASAGPSSAAEAAPTESPSQGSTGSADLLGGAGPATGGGTGGTAAPAQPSGPTPCRANTLTVSLGSGDAAAGTSYVQLLFTNKGSRACVIQGFAGVSYVTGDNGTQVGAAAERDGTKGGPVTLAPRAVASATLARVQVLNYDESVCRPTPVRGLRVYPPGDTASVFVPTDGTGCAGTPPGPQLRISAVKAGRGQS
ncbi:MAG TPA: DUF4232 domain-containing protein [Pseudonocardia sp.]|nr:DUF4232 domain-containing protein [Pseudonocardia sp.]